MKILLLGFPVLAQAFRQCGHEVFTCTTDQRGDVWIDAFPVEIERVFQALPSGWQPDGVLLMDESTEPMYLGLERVPVPVAWYTIDAHLHVHWHKLYAAVFDAVFVAQQSYVSDYEYDADRQIVRWLPLFCNPERDRYAALPKLYDVSFVGRINPEWKPERSRLLDAIAERIPLHLATGEYVTVFNRSKIVLNESAANDVNFRVFEALACGSLLLTERVGNGFESLFQDREHVVMYDRRNIDQIVDLARFYLAHDNERDAIAQRGRAAVLAAHTTVHRAQTIAETMETMARRGAAAQRHARACSIHEALARVYEHGAGVYGMAAQRYHDSPARYEECCRTVDMYRSAQRALHGQPRESLLPANMSAPILS